ncbi:MAG: GGDEF domain-containing protein [Firmicutes bacterium]|nr:GGDEF domain-containing protein [Bacillota bacterium]
MDTLPTMFYAFVNALLQCQEPDMLALDGLEGDTRKLAESLNTLAHRLSTSHAYAAALARGELSCTLEDESLFCQPLNALHARLNLLTWQMRQVTAGDSDQRRFFWDETAGALDAPANGTARERMKDIDLDEQGARQSDALALFVYLTNSLKLGVVIADKSTHEILFANDKANEFFCDELKTCLHGQASGRLRQAIIEYECRKDGPYRWELTCNQNALFYQVESYALDWHGKHTCAHIIEDVTQKTAQTSALIQDLYRDDMTGLYNRRFCIKEINELLSGDTLFTICYFDIDDLKSVNDRFLHSEGDAYIKLVVNTVKRSIRMEDIFARLGGDEFCVLFRGTPKSVVEDKFASISAMISANSYAVKPYGTAISYGVLEVAAGSGLDVETLLLLVDKQMYTNKRTHKLTPENGRKVKLNHPLK